MQNYQARDFVERRASFDKTSFQSRQIDRRQGSVSGEFRIAGLRDDAFQVGLEFTLVR